MQVESVVVVFAIEQQRYGLWLSSVERIVRMVEISTLPHAPEIVLGVVDVGGGVIPVIDLRSRFRHPAREPQLEDRLIVARTSRRRVALVVDSVAGAEPVAAAEWIEGDSIVPGTRYVAGVARRPDGLILIHDLEALLSLDEERALDAALPAHEVPA